MESIEKDEVYSQSIRSKLLIYWNIGKRIVDFQKAYFIKQVKAV